MRNVLPPQSCESPRTDTFVSYEQARECMMTSFILPTTHPRSTSCNSMRFFSNVIVKKESPWTDAGLALQSRSLSKSLSITRAAEMKDDDEGPLQGLIPLQEQLG